VGNLVILDWSCIYNSFLYPDIKINATTLKPFVPSKLG
jgi:hypothetical protein